MLYPGSPNGNRWNVQNNSNQYPDLEKSLQLVAGSLLMNREVPYCPHTPLNVDKKKYVFLPQGNHLHMGVDTFLQKRQKRKKQNMHLCIRRFLFA